MKGTVIRLQQDTLYINNNKYKLPQNKTLKVNDNGIFCGLYELKNNKWKITIKAIKEVLKYA